MLADLESLERRIDSLEKRARGGDKESAKTLDLVRIALDFLHEGKPARLAWIAEEDKAAFRALGLLTSKRVLYVCNVDESSAASGNQWSRKVQEKVADQSLHPLPAPGHATAKAGAPKPPAVVVISAKIEAEIAVLPYADRAEYLAAIGLNEPGLDRLIRAGYDLLDLITFFTGGPKEARAWTVPRGTRAPQAAGVIHTDFEKGFIRAETITYEDYVALNGESGARDAGKLRLEGKDHIVQDGDVLHFRFAT
jgi:GTP-binding protein YchF